jgi:predicted transcriptional regulator
LLIEHRILKIGKLYEKLLISGAMDESVLVKKETNCPSIIPMMEQFQVALVTDRGKLVGIITTTD